MVCTDPSVGEFPLPTQQVETFTFEVLAADTGMTALSWLLIAGVPVVPLVVWELVLVILRRGSDGPLVAMIPVFVTSALFSAICQSALLRYFKQRVAKSEFLLLAGINLFCLLLAFYRMYVFAVAHPPEA
jgi:hypothetical protein